MFSWRWYCQAKDAIFWTQSSLLAMCTLNLYLTGFYLLKGENPITAVLRGLDEGRAGLFSAWFIHFLQLLQMKRGVSPPLFSCVHHLCRGCRGTLDGIRGPLGHSVPDLQRLQSLSVARSLLAVGSKKNQLAILSLIPTARGRIRCNFRNRVLQNVTRATDVP